MSKICNPKIKLEYGLNMNDKDYSTLLLTLVKSIENRHLNYNKSLDLVKELEDKGDALVIRPKSPVKVSQIEKDVDKLTKLYNEGYNDAKESYEKIIEFIKK